jgi:four helix bundle protein
MFRVYEEVLEVIRGLRGILIEIERRDADLARQIRRAASSVALNIAEANGSRGGNRRVRFASALGSMRETLAGLQVAGAFGYVPVDDEVPRKIDRICAALYSLAR